MLVRSVLSPQPMAVMWAARIMGRRPRADTSLVVVFPARSTALTFTAGVPFGTVILNAPVLSTGTFLPLTVTSASVEAWPVMVTGAATFLTSGSATLSSGAVASTLNPTTLRYEAKGRLLSPATTRVCRPSVRWGRTSLRRVPSALTGTAVPSRVARSPSLPCGLIRGEVGADLRGLAPVEDGAVAQALEGRSRCEERPGSDARSGQRERTGRRYQGAPTGRTAEAEGGKGPGYACGGHRDVLRAVGRMLPPFIAARCPGRLLLTVFHANGRIVSRRGGWAMQGTVRYAAPVVGRYGTTHSP